MLATISRFKNLTRTPAAMISHESKEVLKGVVTMIPGVKQMLPKGVSGGKIGRAHV
mgnify:CR=1 FL=1